MERRIKLTMAAMALGLLVAGGFRRWAKEVGFTLFGEPQESAVVETQYESPVEYEARQTAAWLTADQEVVAPAAAQFPVGRVNKVDIAESGASRESFLSRPQYAPAPPINSSPAAPYESASPQNTGPAPAAVPGAPPGYYVIQANDSFWKISQRVYGTGRYFQALYEYNRLNCPQPDRLLPGVTIQTPEPYLLERAFPDLFR